MSKLITLDSIRQRRNALFNTDDVQELSERYWDNPYTFVPPKDFDIFLSDKAPRNKKEVALWIYTCLYSNGLVGFFSNKANDRNLGHASQIDFIAESFLEQVGNCIVLGNRSGGKTLAFATLLLLESLFKPGIELAHLGAIELQAKNCFKYYRSMISHRLFAGNLTRKMNSYNVTLKNGSQVNILGGTLAAVNCLHGDTLIECSRDITKYPNGMPIKELVGKTVAVPTIHEETGSMEYRLAEGVYSGKAPCVKVTLSFRGRDGIDKTDSVICTPDHPFLMLNSHKYRKAKNLLVGDRIVPYNTPYTKLANSSDTRHTAERRTALRESWNTKKYKLLAEHRAIAAAILGQEFLKDPDQHIHHIDGNRLNNSLENLEVMNKLDHHKLHFGEDSQKFITKDSLTKMSKSKTKYNVEVKWQDKEWLEEEIWSTKTMAEIARECNCEAETIRSWVVKHDLMDLYKKLHPVNARNTGGAKGITQDKEKSKRDEVWRNPDWLKENLSKLTLQQTADKAGCNLSTIKDWCKRLGVEKPKSIYDNSIKQPWRDAEQLIPLLQKGLDNTTIASIFGVQSTLISKYVNELNLTSYRPSENKLFKDKEWLESKLNEGLAINQIAALCNSTFTTIKKYMNKFNLVSNWKRGDNQHEGTPFFENHVVVSVEPYMNNEPQDVYDLTVLTTEDDNGFRHNFGLSVGVLVHNSPHPNKASIDEIDLMDYNILQEAFSMVSDKGMQGLSGNNWKPALRLTSTRKFSDGSMQKMLNEADAKGFKIYQWNIMDTVEPCRIASSIERNPIRDPDDKDCIVAVSDECLTCKSLDRCLGKAKYANGGMVSLEVMRNMAQILDTVKWDTQWMCNRAEESSLIFNMFDTKIHVIDYNATLANLGIISDKEALEDVAHYNPDIDVVAGQDAGYECPATVIGQYLTDDTFVIFQEIDERRVANSVFIEDYLLPAANEYNIAEFFCDPSNPMLMAEMELNGMYVTPATNSIQLGLDLVKSMFKSNTLYIDKRCTTLIKTLGTYKKRMNSLGSPRPNQDDHHIDAMRYLLMMVADPEDAIIDDVVTSV